MVPMRSRSTRAAAEAINSIPQQLVAETRLLEIQQELFDLGGELALPTATLMDSAGVERLEATIEQLNATLPPLVPYGNAPVASGDFAMGDKIEFGAENVCEILRLQ